MTEARRTHRLPSTWVQMAIIPTNSDSDASAAASWITVLNMTFLSGTEREHSSCYVLKSSDVKRPPNWRLSWWDPRRISLALIHLDDRAFPQSHPPVHAGRQIHVVGCNDGGEARGLHQLGQRAENVLSGVQVDRKST